VGKEDIARAYSLFVDVKRSVQYLKNHESEYLISGEQENDTSGDVAMKDS